MLGYSTHCQGITQFYLHTLHFILKWSELYLHLPSQPQLVRIYRPWRDGRLSRPWCEVAHAKIRNLRASQLQIRHSTTSTLVLFMLKVILLSCLQIDIVILDTLIIFTHLLMAIFHQTTDLWPSE